MAPSIPLQPRSLMPQPMEPPDTEALTPTAGPSPDLQLLDADQQHVRAGVGAPEVPGTRHGVGGRIKDFLETLLLTGGNPIAAGVAAGKTGLLANYKENVYNRPRRQADARAEGDLQAQREQGRYRQSQQRKIEGDIAEDEVMRPHRIDQMKAETILRKAQADKALRPEQTRPETAQILPDTESLMRWNPITQRAEPILGPGDEGVKRFIKPERTEMTPEGRASHERSLNDDADKLAAEVEGFKSKATLAGADVGAMSRALSSPEAQSAGGVSFGGKWVTPGDLERAEAARQVATNEYNNAQERLNSVRGRLKPQANSGGRTVMHKGKPHRVVRELPNGQLELEPIQ